MLTFTSAPNFEAPADADTNNDYVVVVRATSGTGAREKTADQTITVTVTDEAGEAPGAPATPSVSSASATSLNVSWAAPSNAGPPITDYDYRYRVKTPPGSWTEVTTTPITALGAPIAGLAENTEYEVQVRATNAEGTGDWSDPPGSGATDANAAPSFTSPATFDAAENQLAVGTVAAADGDPGDSVTGYALQSGADRSQFTIVEATGVLTFTSAPNFEAAADADTDNDYVVVVRATSGTGAREKTADQTITVTVTDEAGEAPGAPATPSVSTASATSLNVSWAAPSNAGPPITELRPTGTALATAGDWTEVTTHADGTALERDDHGAGGEHGVRGAGAGDQRRGHGRLVRPPGQRRDGRERGAVVHLAGDGRRGGEPDRGGDGRGGGRRPRRQRDGLRAPGRRGPVAVHDRRRDRRADVHVGAELRGSGGCGREQRLRGGGAGDQRHGRAGEDGGPDDHGDGDGRGRRGAGRPGHALGVVGLGNESERFLGRAVERRAGDHGLRLPVPGEDAAGVVDGGDDHADHGARRDDRGAGGEHGVRGAGAGDQRRGHGRLVRPPGSGSTDANAAPSFTTLATFDVVENQTVVGTVAAADRDPGDSVTGYALQGGADRSQFTIVEATGVLTFTSAPNFEAAADADTDNDYVVVVRATSGTGARLKTADQTITVTVTDEAGEAPGAPATPSVSTASATSLNVSWTAPSNAGPPITSYDLQYRIGDSGDFTAGPQDVAGTSATIAGLAENTEYEVQVRATNAEGTGDWSDPPGRGATDANAAPSFTSSATVDAAENQTAVGTVAAADGDPGDSVTGYALQGGADQSRFTIVASTGVLTSDGDAGDSVTSAPNFEAPADADTDNDYVVVVRATSGTGAREKTADQTITVTVTDEAGEAPGAPATPAAPSVSATSGSATSLDVSWTAPANTGRPAITSYDLQYRIGDSGGFTTGPQDVTGLRTAIEGLTANTGYEVQVRATNAEGDSGWSASGAGSTSPPANNAPEFSDATLTRSIAENMAPNTNVGAAIPAATDADSGDTLTYAMEGTDAVSFTFEASSRRIKTKRRRHLRLRGEVELLGDDHGLGRHRQRHGRGDDHRHGRGRATRRARRAERVGDFRLGHEP